MKPEQPVTIAIVGAGPDGVPTVARCQECGERWTRPPGDPSAASLALWGAGHQHAGGPPPATICKQSGVVVTVSRDAGERARCPLCGRWLVITPEYRWPRHERGEVKP